MKPQNLHAQEDRLLDFVYGELPPVEARAVESHLEGCARCKELLADIRGVRTTMSQLPMEPAPDAGLESLLAYAQQAARNAAAGPAPKPTWWRRWLVPVVSVAAVCVFGIISIQVSKSVALKPDLTAAKSESVRRDVAAPAEPSPVAAPAPAPTAAAPVQMQAPAATPPAEGKPAPAGAVDQVAQAEATRGDVPGMSPPPEAPAAKLDKDLFKEAPRKSAFVSGPRKPAPDWGNAGAGTGFERAKDAEDERLALAEKKAVADKQPQSYGYEQRDAMTQVAQLKKSKVGSMGSAQGSLAPEPPSTPAAPQPAEDAPATEEALPAQAIAQTAESQRSSLRLSGGRSAATETANKPAEVSAGDDFDDVFGAKNSTGKRERQQASTAMPAPAPPPAAAQAPMPSSSSMGTRAPTAAPKRAEAKGKAEESSVSELTRLADAARSSGNRVLEAQYLRLALEAGATGNVRQGLLNRLCDAEFASGRRQQAIEVCNLVIEENPRSGAAQVARKRISAESPEADTGKVRAGSKAAGKADAMEAPAAATPAVKE